MSIVSNIRNFVADNLKNTIGWRTKRKIVVFAVDDYGNVRLHSKEAKEKLIRAGLKLSNRFDQYDTLETERDLTILYNTLDSVKDKNGNSAVFSALALPVNIDYEKMREYNYEEYFYEKLPETLNKLTGYQNVWKLWQEGMDKKLLIPQFHGREHLNLKYFKDNLKSKEHTTLTALKNRSYTGIQKRGKNVSYTAAFHFEDIEECESQKEIIKDGLRLFEEVYGFKASVFNAPGGMENVIIHEALAEGGIKYIEAPLIKREHQGKGVYETKFYYTGKQNSYNQTFMVRNALFEPTSSNIDWVNFCLEQIEAAFRWNRPAVISSHRVNFCGLIDEKNREKGIDTLQKLLNKIVEKWPDVEFLSLDELGKEISKNK